MEDLESIQRDIESSGRDEGIRRYMHNAMKRDLAEMPPGMALVRELVLPLAGAIEDYVAAQKRTTAKILAIQQIGAEVVAYMTLQRMLNAEAEKLNALATSIGFAIETELWMKDFKARKEKNFAYNLKDVREDTSHKGRQRSRMLRSAEYFGVYRPDWGDNRGKMGSKSAERTSLGQILVEIAIAVCGGKVASKDDPTKEVYLPYFQLETRTENTRSKKGKVKHKSVRYLVHSTRLRRMVARDHNDCALLRPVMPPMVVPPIDWHVVERGRDGKLDFSGGYLTLPRPLLKGARMDYLQDALKEGKLSDFLDGINKIQSSPLRINTAVLDVLERLYELGGKVAGLPSRFNPEKPVKPDNIAELKVKDPGAFTAYKEAAEKYHETVNSLELKTKRHDAEQQLKIARAYAGYGAIWFPHDCDWRGRAYPMVSYLHPQGNTVSKGLLEHADGLPLDDRSAVWLAVHGANCYEAKVPGCNPEAGDKMEKASYSERVQWVRDNEAAILHAAAFPLENDWWLAAEKPPEFLAFCFEWAGWRLQGPGYVSHINVAMDGTNNGLQWYAGLLLNTQLALEVNLIPGDKPRDIYSKVAREVSPVVVRDSISGEYQEVARKLVGKINRKWAKRPLMTRPYGSTSLVALRKQLLVEGEKDGGYLLEFPQEDRWGITCYMARALDSAIDDNASAANVGMRFFKDVATLANKAGRDIIWTTPDGLKVHQRYEKQKSLKVQTVLSGSIFVKPKRIQATVNESTGEIDKSKQLRCPPNVVHSLDATMLRVVVRRLHELGITSFIGVHDSYGTHAANVESMQQVIREVFVEICTQPLLALFASEVLADLPKRLAKRAPKVPDMGDLDLQQVLESDYFFA